MEIAIRKFLPRGCAKQLATELDCSVNKIVNVIYGRSKDDVILAKLLKLAKERKERNKRIEEEKAFILN